MLLDHLLVESPGLEAEGVQLGLNDLREGGTVGFNGQKGKIVGVFENGRQPFVPGMFG